MRGTLAALVGAICLAALTAYYHLQLPADRVDAIEWQVVLLQAAPAGLVLGTAIALAFRSPAGGRRALCCFLGGLLALVPFAILAWLTATGDPFRAVPALLKLSLLSAPTFVLVFLVNLWGIANLRPTRLRQRTQDEKYEPPTENS